MNKQINKYFDHILSKYQFGLSKGYSAVMFIAMTEIWWISLDQNGPYRVLFKDLSKLFLDLFECLPDDFY